ncbi:MAG: hypothetical protein U0M63_12625 [Alistipes onderdonkii]|jgi:hypothetical protein|uniref:hypothetical protein n=1 Tax=Alistipes onderdonkii TaxID=328813 RepID=UPI001873957A|nr:hypothetical protein [Alistipes onderdonkii]MBE5046148.1 hypothetical protein [Alistipes onderdonkii]MEE0850496.1 hypothetical protein [Alistipes onderdonkii]
MKKVFLLVTAFLFVQCIPGGGYWRYPVKNTSDREVIFGIDVNVVNGKIYPRASYDEPSDEFFDFTCRLYPQWEYYYPFVSKTSRRQFVRDQVFITIGDTVSVYAIDPIDLEMYSWDEIREKKKFWFARVVLDANSDYIYFPFELNR